MLVSVIGIVSKSLKYHLEKTGIMVYEGYYITIEGKHLMSYMTNGDGYSKAIVELDEDVKGTRFGEAYEELLAKVHKQKLGKLLEK